jgi:hypothetical protein
MTKMSADEKRWRAEEDARTMKRAMEIQKDPSRMSAAQGVIKKELSTLANITGHKVVPKSTATTNTKKRR